MPVLKTDKGFVVVASSGKPRAGPFKTEAEAARADNIVEQVVVGESANQGEAGARMVAEVLRNRASFAGTDFEREATKSRVSTKTGKEVFQFSAMAGFPAVDQQGKPRTKPLQEFYGEQPDQVRARARFVLNEVASPEYQPKFLSPDGYLPPDHYMTAELYNSPKRPSWAKDMKVVAEVGDHVVLARKKAVPKQP